jgi:hypothetical protein
MRIGQDIDWRNVGVARQNGMLISHRAKNLQKFTGTKPFDMFLCVIGQSGSQILRAAENPAHTEFEFDRITDPVERKKKLKEYSEFTREIRELIREHAAIDSSAEVFTADLDDFFGGFNTASKDQGESEKSLDLVVHKARRATFSPGSPVKLGGDGEDDGTNEAEKGGVENKTSGGKENKRSEGKAGGEKQSAGLEVLDPRIVRTHNSNTVEVYFTPTIKNSFIFSLYRSGEADREASNFKIVKEKTWRSNFVVGEVKKIQRIKLVLELHPEEQNYVHEVVIHNAK